MAGGDESTEAVLWTQLAGWSTHELAGSGTAAGGTKCVSLGCYRTDSRCARDNLHTMLARYDGEREAACPSTSVHLILSWAPIWVHQSSGGSHQMAEHEPLDIADRDRESAEKPEARAARLERPTQGARAEGTQHSDANVRSDDAMVGSEPMDLQRLPEPNAHVPPGRQRTGDPPAPRRARPANEG